MRHNISDIQKIFHTTFGDKYKTRLEFGADEPFYQAAHDNSKDNIIYCREDFFASSLHEIAHWCLAGVERRQKDDYGFWYSPDGRDIEKQLLFEKVEVKPQAIEKAFSVACGYTFKASVDNLHLVDHDPSDFITNINAQYERYLKASFPKRASEFIQALKEFYS